MAERRLLIATTNPAKLRDLQEELAFLEEKGVELVGIHELDPSFLGFPENGTTFAENASSKALGASQRYGLAALADDGGLEIEALGGEPGVMSRRWPGYPAGDEELIAYALTRTKDLPPNRRKARFRTVVAFATPEGKLLSKEAALWGEIAEKVHPARNPGYPYRSLFWIPELQKYAVEFSLEEERQWSHRRAAVRAMLPAIRSYFAL
jgi:XTP/dITP diphosphohydrolase